MVVSSYELCFLPNTSCMLPTLTEPENSTSKSTPRQLNTTLTKQIKKFYLMQHPVKPLEPDLIDRLNQVLNKIKQDKRTQSFGDNTQGFQLQRFQAKLRGRQVINDTRLSASTCLRGDRTKTRQAHFLSVLASPPSTSAWRVSLLALLQNAT